LHRGRKNWPDYPYSGLPSRELEKRTRIERNHKVCNCAGSSDTVKDAKKVRQRREKRAGDKKKDPGSNDEIKCNDPSVR